MFYVLNMYFSRCLKMQVQVGVPNWFQVDESRKSLVKFLVASS